MEFNQKHPMILPQHKLMDLIIKHKHLENLHAGNQTLLAIIRREFWPINAKNAVKGGLRSYTTCFRVNPRGYIPKMGDLPKNRVTPARPFYNTGLDFAGPQSLIHYTKSR
ncbi:hypothetical protein Trydic_g14643 [Trypoxylus dichotomus]